MSAVSWGYPDGPAFQRTDARYSGDARLGLSPLGTCPLGGTEWPPVFLPALAVGSDDLTKQLRKTQDAIVKTRGNIVTGKRVRASKAIWTVIIKRGLDAAGWLELMDFFEQDSFYLLPAGLDSTRIEVVNVGDIPRPVSLRNGFYEVQFTIQEK